MNDYNFKVIAELKNDLSKKDRIFAEDQFNKLQRKWKIKKLDDITYVKDGNIKDIDDIGAVSFFFLDLKDIKKYFSILRYNDLWYGQDEIAI